LSSTKASSLKKFHGKRDTLTLASVVAKDRYLRPILRAGAKTPGKGPRMVRGRALEATGAAYLLRFVCDLYRMKGFLWFFVFSGSALWLDETYCGGKYTQATIQMFTEMALWMHLTG
jgi:hypothetical protein